MTLTQAEFQKQLKDVRSKLEYYTDEAVFTTENDEQLKYEDWKKIFGDMTPTELVAHFAKLGNPWLALKIQREGLAKLRLIILPDGDTASPAPENQLKFLLSKPATMADTPEIQAHFAYASIAPELQGQHSIRQYMANAVELLRKLGAQRCTVNTEKVGGYAWAKFGFVPATENEWNDLKENIQRHHNLHFNVLFHGGVNRELLPAETAVIKQVMNTPLADLHNAFPQLAELNRVLYYDADDHAITVGKALLVGTSWHGALVMRDHHTSFERFKAYTDPEHIKARSMA
jgi:hypothetical protein